MPREAVAAVWALLYTGIAVGILLIVANLAAR